MMLDLAKDLLTIQLKYRQINYLLTISVICKFNYKNL